ncbi:Leucine-rich repeat-containing N-terminal plant-type protein [Dioscorea alata]|uniref:Leucine-rich repeat-containing N-terminal plant-type protein n=1 Tax=Dioscorea alata TaxID=55571 RepID=A0ACB7U6F8_DIOAL|nr:Leucine-rich repeat-containing N-terminal plant-type protein [Dioscorea alata]
MLLSSCFPLLISSAKCHKDDKKALLKLKAGFGNPELLPWTSHTDCCSWLEVICSSHTGRVAGLIINFANLSGTISPSIGDLPFLDTFLIQYSSLLTGTIPYSITKLPLTGLTIKFTSLSGPIPGFLGELKDLENLDLSGNLHTGPIPDSIAALPKLNRLVLNDNHLTGKIPISLGEADLSYIYLAGNRFYGDASFLFGQSKRAIEIDLSRNQLEMDMSLLSFPQSLRLLDLSLNRIEGTILAGLAGLIDLSFFNVSHNMLCGSIPTGGRMNLFDASCYQHNKCLCGTPLPSCHHALAALISTATK